MLHSRKAVYASPEVEVQCLGSESVLCVSTGDQNQNYVIGDPSGWF